MKTLEQLRIANPYLQLDKEFYSLHSIAPLNNIRLLHINPDVLALLELDEQEAQREDFIDWLLGKKGEASERTFAMCYAGHQFGHFVPRLGDGRAIMRAQIRRDDGQLYDMQLKGAGQTLYSRGADGRAVLRSTIREYLCSEAMHHLGIASSRALCLLGSDEEVYRERIEPGAMLLRVAPSHIRFGSFEYFYYRGNYRQIKKLADFCLQHYFSEFLSASEPYLAWFEHIIDTTAKMIAQWQAVGFAHGVMNTDNMSVHGLTLDYGPFGFLDAYQPGFICNHSDHSGRYAFDQQPNIAYFNLSCLAQALLPLFDEQPEKSVEKAKTCLDLYPQKYSYHYARQMRRKLGWQQQEPEDQQLTQQLLDLMAKDRVDYCIFFRRFSHQEQHLCRDLFIDRQGFDAWMQKYKKRLEKEKTGAAQRSLQMKRVNPKYILRNYIAQQVIEQAEKGDYRELQRVFKMLQKPFDEQPEMEHYADFPPEWADKISLSCSS